MSVASGTKLVFWEFKEGRWLNRGIDTSLGMESVSISAVEPDVSDELWVTVFGYTRPSTLFLMTADELCNGLLDRVLVLAIMV
eukprot:g4149.t1